ncbi:MAG: Rieske (2Fe-2S) protein [Gemmatimonadetes bacterium]|nr:Rieske (2Fe-2S) protein [Gemmatimonadota bacterium]
MKECNETTPMDPCAGCSGRRDFLRDAAGMAAALFVSLGSGSASAQGMALKAIRALSATADQATYAIPAADGASIDRDREVIVARYRGRVYAFALSCPHQHTALKWEPEQGRFQCPKHHSRYTPDGSFISGRATRAMDRFSVRKAGASLVVDLDQLHRQDHDRAGWDAAFVPV